MSNFSTAQQIDFAISYAQTNISAIARAMGMPQQNLHRKIAQNTLKKEDLCKIAEILGGEYVSYFFFFFNIKIGDGTYKKGRNL
jgi:hypothetical protein